MIAVSVMEEGPSPAESKHSIPKTGTEESDVALEYSEGPDDANLSSAESEKHEEISPSASASSSSIPGEPSMADFKTYDFMHYDAEKDYLITDGEMFDRQYLLQGQEKGRRLRRYIFPEAVRNVMGNYYKMEHRERIRALQSSSGNFPDCPRGDLPEQCKRRKSPGPFLQCPFGQNHECGDEFWMVDVETKQLPEWEPGARPAHFKEKRAKFFKQCKSCEVVGFSHYRNPAQHYQDYLNKVTYKQHNSHAKVWPQHLADLKYSLVETDPQYEDILEKCRDYKPSSIIIYAWSFFHTEVVIVISEVTKTQSQFHMKIAYHRTSGLFQVTLGRFLRWLTNKQMDRIVTVVKHLARVKWWEFRFPQGLNSTGTLPLQPPEEPPPDLTKLDMQKFGSKRDWEKLYRKTMHGEL